MKLEDDEISKVLLNKYMMEFHPKINESLINQGWNPNYVKISDFYQDTTGCTYKDEEGNEVIVDPTYNWHCRVYSQRLKDGEFFVCSTIFLNEEIKLLKKSADFEGIVKNILNEDVNNIIETMQEFIDCDCKADYTCEKHKI